jgi:hypothetical protein
MIAGRGAKRMAVSEEKVSFGGAAHFQVFRGQRKEETAAVRSEEVSQTCRWQGFWAITGPSGARTARVPQKPLN